MRRTNLRLARNPHFAPFDRTVTSLRAERAPGSRRSGTSTGLLAPMVAALVTSLALSRTVMAQTSPAAAALPGATAPSKEAALPDGTKEEARSHFQRGIQFYSDGDYKLALVEFRRAYELSRNFRILYNIGQVNQQLGNYSNALTALEQYVREGGDSIPDARRNAILNDQAQLRTKVAQLEISVNVDNADVLVDDGSVGKSPIARPIVVDAGDHRVEVRREGYQPSVRTVTVAAREAAKLELRLTENKAVVVMAPGPVPEDRQGKKNTTLQWVGWVSAGAMAVGAGITGAMATTQANQLSTLRDSPTSTQAQRENAQNQARGFALASDVLAAAALATGAAALYFTLRPTKSTTGGIGSETRLGLAPNGVLLEHRY